MEPDRLNSPSTCTISLEVLGNELQFAQDPNSKNHGTTVWDASMVLVKFLEKNSRKGRFSAAKLKGKRVIELGAGCGVAGFGMALLGCDVVSTDQSEVIPILKRNVERNSSRIAQMNPESFGSIEVAELDWGNENHIKAVGPPFDYVIGTDVVYAEHLLEPLLRTVLALSGPKTTFMLGYEMRSTSVHEQMLQMWKENFEVKTVPKNKMDARYQDPSIQVFIMGVKSSAGNNYMNGASDKQIDEAETKETSKSSESSNELERVNYVGGQNNMSEDSILTKLRDGKLSDWEARRYGTVAARLLRDVKINVQLPK